MLREGNTGETIEQLQTILFELGYLFGTDQGSIFLHGVDGNFDGTSAKNEKQELAKLLEQEKKNDIFRRLPLYSFGVTGQKWFCSSCYDKTYWSSRRKAELELINTNTGHRAAQSFSGHVANTDRSKGVWQAIVNNFCMTSL